MLREVIPGFRRDERGAMAAIYALSLPALVAVAGLGFDYARLAALDTELQNAADQAALAAATQLDQSEGAIAAAIGAAQGGLVSNSTLFANDDQNANIDVPEGQVFFYETREDAEAGTNPIDTGGEDADADARFVRVQVETRTANYALTPIAGAISATIDAQAVAGVGAALCRTPPLMICNPAEPEGNEDPNYDFDIASNAGKGLLVKGGGGNKWAPGNFGYLDTVPGTGGGTPDLMKALGWTSPPGDCVAQDGNVTVNMETGNHASVADAVNTRFDIYNGNLTNVCPAGGTCPPSINVVKDVVHPANADGTADTSDSNACGIHGKGWKLPVNRYLPDSDAPVDPTTAIDAMGLPRDMCHSTDPATCDSPFGDGQWDRDAYFRVHYGWDTATWTSQVSSSATRYQVYLWEIENSPSGLLPRSVGNVGTPAAAHGSYGRPVCSTKGSINYGSGVTPTEFSADRRRISVAIVNCVANGVKGASTGVPVRRWMDVFLVQPSLDRDRTSKDEIYVEVIEETRAGSAGETAGTVIRRDVPYLIR